MKTENWVKEAPTEEGGYWFRTTSANGVFMKVESYQDLQSGISLHLVASPQLPYEHGSKPAFRVASLSGEWLRDDT